MTNTMYPASVETFTDEQIQVLMAEIEESGLLSDRYDYDEESWEYAAGERWNDLLREQNKRSGVKPLSITALTEITRHAMAKFAERMQFTVMGSANAFTGKIGANMALRLPIRFGGHSGPSTSDYSDIPALNPADFVLS